MSHAYSFFRQGLPNECASQIQRPSALMPTFWVPGETKRERFLEENGLTGIPHLILRSIAPLSLHLRMTLAATMKWPWGDWSLLTLLTFKNWSNGLCIYNPRVFSFSFLNWRGSLSVLVKIRKVDFHCQIYLLWKRILVPLCSREIAA